MPAEAAIMHFDLRYGDGTVPLDVDDRRAPHVIHLNALPVLKNPLEEARRVLASPTGHAPLAEDLRSEKPEKIVVVINDETRPTPYEVFFPALLEAFSAAGVRDDQVTFLIATGTHRLQSDELNRRLYGSGMIDRFRFVCHVCTDDSSLVSLGMLPSGYEFVLNRLAVEADYLITLGVVSPHYFAGYSGGRKSILPGICGKKTVQDNHARMVEILDHMPPIRENPISLEMIEAARKVGVNFVFNAVMNADNQVVRLVAGDLVEAWYEAVDTSSSMYEIPFTEPVDIAVSSACGYPRDVNWYQAQKVIDHADKIVKPGGTIIVCGECRDGYGNKVFEEWMKKKLPPEEVMREIRAHFVLGGHKAFAFAKVASEKKLVLVSSMNAEDTATLYGTKAASVQEAFDQAVAACPDASIAIMPEGGLTLPVHMNA